MGVARIDLADAGSPERIVMEILSTSPISQSQFLSKASAPSSTS